MVWEKRLGHSPFAGVASHPHSLAGRPAHSHRFNRGKPTFGQMLLFGVGLEARPGLATPDMVDDVFSPPELEPSPPVCTYHPSPRAAPPTTSPPSSSTRGKS